VLEVVLHFIFRSSSIFVCHLPSFFKVVILVFQKKMRLSSFSFFVLRSSSFFIFFNVVFHSFGGRLSSWIKIRLNTENQLTVLPRSALKVSVDGWVVWCGPTHYFVNPNLELRLSWAVTTSC
jgi:hypothetical protein